MRRHIPIDKVVEVANKAREATQSVNNGLTVAVLVDKRTPRWLAETIKEALVPQMGATTVDVRRLSGSVRTLEGADLAVVLAGGSDREVSAGLRAYASAGVPCVVCAETSLDVPEGTLNEEEASLVSLAVGSEPEALLGKLCDWMLDAADPVAVAANFEFCREAETERLVQRCALSNAVLGTVNLFHGADLPLMVANQAKLALDIAAAHGEGMGPTRLAEVAAVAGAGVFYRGVARALCDRVKPLSFAIRGGVGYVGSLTTGAALAARFGETPAFAADVKTLLSQTLEAVGKGSGRVSPGSTAAMPRAVLDSAQLDYEASHKASPASGSGDASSEGENYIVIEGGGEPA